MPTNIIIKWAKVLEKRRKMST